MTDPFELLVPRPPSTKNSRRLVTVGGRAMSLPSTGARLARREFHASVLSALGRVPREPLFGDEDVAVVAQHLIESDQLRLRIVPLGPRQRGVTGRRADLQNILEGPLDWLEGFVYANDRQVCRIHLERVHG